MLKLEWSVCCQVWCRPGGGFYFQGSEISVSKTSTTVQYGYSTVLHRWQPIFTSRNEKVLLEQNVQWRKINEIISSFENKNNLNQVLELLSILFHCISCHVVALHFIALLGIALHCMALCVLECHFIARHCIACHCIACHCIACHCIACHCIAYHCIACHCIACHALHVTALHVTALHVTALHVTALHVTALHCIWLSPATNLIRTAKQPPKLFSICFQKK